MAEELSKGVTIEKAMGEESLLPQETRIMDSWSYLAAWIGACIYIGAFMLGASLVPPTGKLNLLQAFIVLVMSMVIVSICFVLNGKAGHRYGIPFVVQSRPAFGIKGSKLPAVIRAVPAICWFGVQTWVGALALNEVSKVLIGFENIVFWFVFFQVIQIVLSAFGFKGIKWLENIGAIVIIISLFYMLYILTTMYSAQISEKLVKIPGTWGISFWASTTAIVGIFTTVMLNISDYSREYTKEGSSGRIFLVYLLGSVPTTTFMCLIGLLAAGITGQWDPIALFVLTLPNKFILVVALLFIALAQITTNVMLNVVPPAYVLMDMFGMKWRTAAIVTGLLAFLTFPWKIVTASGFFLFIQIYSVFLGPIFAVMMVDYYLIRKENLELKQLYDTNGPYKGINWAGIIAIIIGAAFGALKVELSWYLSLIPSAATYYILMKTMMAKTGYMPKGDQGTSITIDP